MIIVHYKYKDFDVASASAGKLCLMIKENYNSSTNTIDSATVSEDKKNIIPNENLKGAGISTVNGHIVSFIVDSIEYQFDSNGNPSSKNATGWLLYLGEIIDSSKPQDIGTVIIGSSSAITRSAVGTVISYDFGATDSVVVDQLNSRDAFAMQALQGIMERMNSRPDAASDNEMNHLTSVAYRWAANMMMSAAQARATYKDETQSSTVNVDSLNTNTEKLLNNIKTALEKTDATIQIGEENKTAERITIPELNKLIESYVKHTPGEGEPATKTTVGLDDLIEAIKGIEAGGGGSTEIDFSTLITALQGLSTDRAITALPDVNIGNTGLGRDSDHPIYISGGGFPSRQVLPAAFVAEDSDTNKVIHDLLTFNATGAVGYSTKAEAKKALLGFLNDYADINTLSAAVLATLTGADIYNKIQSNIDSRIQQWLNAARDAEGRPLTVNTPT